MSTTPSPKVSVIMNCLNGEKYVGEAIDSVFAQTFTDWEIVFFDNASTDSSADIAKRYGSKLRYFRNEKTVSLGEARNHALDLARGEYIAFLDCDDTWLPEKLEKQVGILETHPGIGFVHGNMYLIDEIKNRRYLVLKTPQPQGMIFERMLNNYAIGLLCVMFRKTILKKVGSYFDIKLNFASDYDLFLRILHETNSHYFKEPLAQVRLHPSMTSIKGYVNRQDEVSYVIDKFSRLYDGFEKMYPDVLRQSKIRLAYSQVWLSMAKGDLRAVRQRKDIVKMGNVKLLMLYAAAFMPVKLWFAAWNLWSTIKGNKDTKKTIVDSLQRTRNG